MSKQPCTTSDRQPLSSFRKVLESFRFSNVSPTQARSNFRIETLEERTVLSATPIGEEFPVYANDGRADASILLMDDEGDMALVWQRGYEWYVQLIQPGGDLYGWPKLIAGGPDSSQGPVVAAMDGDGDFVVAWASGAGEIKFQRFDQEGEQLGSVTAITGSIYDANLHLAMNGAGDFVLGWNSDDDLVSIQAFDQSGLSLGESVEIEDFRGVTLHGLGMDETGYLVLTTEERPLPPPLPPFLIETVLAYRFDLDGIAQSETALQGVDPESDAIAVSMDRDGHFVVAWSNSDGVWAQRFDAAATAAGESIFLTDDSADLLDVVASATGGFAVSWARGSSYFVQAFDASGDTRGEILTVPSGADYTSLTMNALGDLGITYPTVLDPDFPLQLVLLPSDEAEYSSPITISRPELRANFPNQLTVHLDPFGNVVAGYLGDADGFAPGFLQRFDAGSNPVGLPVNTDPILSIDGISNGDYLVTTYRNQGVDARWFDSNGTPLTESFSLLEGPLGLWGFDVSMSSDGSFVAIWQDSFTRDIYFRRFGADGNPLGLAVLLAEDTAENRLQAGLTVASNGNGQFVFGWAAENAFEQVGEIQFRQYDFATDSLSAVQRVVAVEGWFNRPLTNLASGVAGDGSFVIAWDQYLSGSWDPGVYAQRFSSGGTAIGDSILVDDGPSYTPEIAMLDSGNWAIVWLAPQVKVAHFNGNGEKVGPELVLGEAENGFVTPPRIAANSAGEIVVVWDQGPNSYVHIRAQRLRLNQAPTTSVTLPELGLRSDGGAGHVVRGQELTLTLQAMDLEDQTSPFTYLVDWNGDGVVDEEIVGSASAMAGHVYTAKGTYNLRVQARDVHGNLSDVVTQAVVVTDWDIRENSQDPGVTDLYVGGTTGNDAYTFQPGMWLTQMENNAFTWIPRVTHFEAFSGVVHVYAQGGNDLVDGSAFDRPMIIHGGEGDDVLIGSSFGDTIYGGAGNDILLASTGVSGLGDWLEGNDGDDLLIGSAGADTLLGGAGQDLLIAGFLQVPNLASAVYSLQSEWTSTRPLAEKVANLQGSGNGERFNGETFLSPGSTVLNDDAVDVLFGGEGDDWLLLDLNADLATDISSGDLVTNLA